MDIKLIVVLLIIVLLTLLGFYLIAKNSQTSKENTEIQYQDKINDVIIETKTFELNNEEFDVSYEMPYVRNLQVDFLNYLNSKIQSEVEYRNVYKEFSDGIENKDKIGKLTYRADFVRYDCSKYTSIVCNQKIQLGVGRMVARKKCYVIDDKEQKTAIIQNLFKDRINYKQYILDEINIQARQNGIELVGGNDLKELSTTQSFYIKDNKMIIYFEAGKISPVANGELEFEMPFTLNQEGLFEKNA